MRTSDKILIAISELTISYDWGIHEELRKDKKETWLSRNLPMIDKYINGLSATKSRLFKLERSGLVWAELDCENKLHYNLTLAGEMRVNKLRDKY